MRPTDLYPGSQAAILAQMARHGRSAGRYNRGLADARGAGDPAALCDGYNPVRCRRRWPAGDPHLLQLVLF